jgi:very-short-patch-repair endonuclease
MKPIYSLQEKREFARAMRQKPTLAERSLWYHLRLDKLGFRFHRQSLQYGYILDFFCPRVRLGIEVDGSVHEDMNIAADDEQKERALESYGVGILRFANEDVLSFATVVLTRIKAECEHREALKASSLGIGNPSQRTDSSSSSRAEALENSVPKWLKSSASNPLHSFRMRNSALGNPEDKLATAEDYAVMRTKFRELAHVRTRWPRPASVYKDMRTPEERIWERSLKAATDEELKRKLERDQAEICQAELEMASSVRKLNATEPQSLVFLGITVERRQA